MNPSPSSTASPSATSSAPTQTSTSSGHHGSTNSPLLFFVALGFGVVFTNLWIIVGVKYCYRYNRRNQQLRDAENGQPIDMATMPRPHRRRREKKLMTMDEVNERFPTTKYKAWRASRESEGLSTAGGIIAPESAPGSIRDADGIISATSDLRRSDEGPRPVVATSTRDDDSTAHEIPEDPIKQIEAGVEGPSADSDKRLSKMTVEEQEPVVEELEKADTLASTVAPADDIKGEDEEEEEDEHIHSAIPPELVNSSGDTCAICLDTLDDDNDVRGLTCGHAFHAACVDPWLTSRRACCPLCKADYYTPKPRPEGEAAAAHDTNRSGRRVVGMTRSRSRGPMLATPTAAFINGRRYPWGSRVIVSGRSGRGPASHASRGRELEHHSNYTGTSSDVTARRSWRPQISNPFRNVSWPSIRVPSRLRRTRHSENGQGPSSDGVPSAPNSSVTPAQLEAGSG
ncbi:MAG: hypothetical protein M1819_002891 [Sarea resinae]|nr:MAG: hypothetical protein M1819_002891 [Sarea resinae]